MIEITFQVKKREINLNGFEVWPVISYVTITGKDMQEITDQCIAVEYHFQTRNPGDIFRIGFNA